MHYLPSSRNEKKVETIMNAFIAVWAISLLITAGLFGYYGGIIHHLRQFPEQPEAQEELIIHNHTLEYKLNFKIQCPPDWREGRGLASFYFNFKDSYTHYLTLLRDKYYDNCTPDAVTCIKQYLEGYNTTIRRVDDYYILELRLDIRNETWIRRGDTLWLGHTETFSVILMSNKAKLNPTVDVMCPEVNDKKYEPYVKTVYHDFQGMPVQVRIHTYTYSEYVEQMNEKLMYLTIAMILVGTAGTPILYWGLKRKLAPTTLNP